MGLDVGSATVKQIVPPQLPAPAVTLIQDAALDYTDSSVENVALIKGATEAAAEQAFKDVAEQQIDLAASLSTIGYTDHSVDEKTMSFKRFTSWFEEKHTASSSSVRITSTDLHVCRRIWREVSNASNQVDLCGLQVILEELLKEGAISITHSGHIVPTELTIELDAETNVCV